LVIEEEAVARHDRRNISRDYCASNLLIGM
jgi:hypothetical protein